jgi:2-keto-3-deoxy-L-rhamnonate aldolase RhmA
MSYRGRHRGGQDPVNPVLTRLASGQPAIGLGVQLTRSGEIALIARATGHDFIWIDMQHALFDLETIHHLALTAIAAGVGCVVRVRSVDDPSTSNLLDSGVNGVVFPNVESAEEA